MGTKSWLPQYHYAADLRLFPTELAAELARGGDDKINEFISWSHQMYQNYEKMVARHDHLIKELQICEHTVKLLQVNDNET